MDFLLKKSKSIEQKAWMSADFEYGLVSVIIPTYNRAAFLSKLFNNLYDLTYRPIEIIIVDDGSSDATPSIVKNELFPQYYHTDFQTHYYRQKNKGASSARNSGLFHSKGEFIQFLDSDDRLLPQKLSVQVKYLRNHPDIHYVYCNTVQIGSTGKFNAIIGKPMDKEKVAMNIALHHWHTTGPLYRRSVCRKAGPWDEALKASQDWDYAARVKAVSQKGIHLPELLSEYIIHTGEQIIKNDSISKIVSRNKAIQNVIEMIKAIGEPDSLGLDICARALVANGITAGARGRTYILRQNMCKARSIGQLKTQCMAFLLYGFSFFIPMILLDRMLKTARKYEV